MGPTRWRCDVILAYGTHENASPKNVLRTMSVAGLNSIFSPQTAFLQGARQETDLRELFSLIFWAPQSLCQSL